MSAAHFSQGASGDRLCGAKVRTVDSDGGETDDRNDVTCKRCLASLAKRDREFRKKTRAWFALDSTRLSAEAVAWVICSESTPADASRAIAREEGRIQ